MEDFIGIIVLVVIWLVAASGRKGKKADKPRAQRQKEQKARGTSFEQAFARRAQAEQKGAPAQQPVSPAPVREPDCERRPIHLHEATQHQMAQAAEGEDPCHPGSAPQEPSPIFEPERTQVDPRAQELLRGVIMSEILTRPCDRAAQRQYRRRA